MGAELRFKDVMGNQLCAVVWVLGVLLVGMGGVSAGERRALSEELAQKLIAQEAEILPGKVTVAVVLQGQARLGEDFETDDAARVVFLWNRTVEGRRVRRVEERTFFWNEKYGWFFYFPSKPRGGEAVDICSETEGVVRVR